MRSLCKSGGRSAFFVEETGVVRRGQEGVWGGGGQSSLTTHTLLTKGVHLHPLNQGGGA